MQCAESRIPLAWAHCRAGRRQRYERGVGSKGPVTSQHAAQTTIEREGRRHLRGGVGDPVPGKCHSEERRVIVVVRRCSHAESNHARIDAARVQVTEVPQCIHAQAGVEGRDV